MFATRNILLQRVTVAEEKSGLMKANESIQRSGPWAWWVHPKKKADLPSISAHGLFLECALCMHMERKFHM